MDVRERREILSETLSLYYWKVEALDTGGNSTFSREVFSFFLGLYVTGDANGDGIVDLNDLLYLASYLFNEGPPPDPLLRGDENGDCIVDSNDLVYLANYLFQSGPPPVRCITRVINKVKTSQ